MIPRGWIVAICVLSLFAPWTAPGFGGTFAFWQNIGAPTIDLNFMSGSLPLPVQFSRASTGVAGTSYNSAGLLVTAPQNIALYSQLFTNAAWSASGLNGWGSGSTQNTSSTTAPDGTSTAAFLQQDTSTGFHGFQQLVNVNQAATYTFSMYAKKGTSSDARVTLSDSSTANFLYAVFNLNTGALSTTSSSAGITVSGSSITSVGNGWYRISVTGQPGTSGTGVRASFRIETTTSLGASFTGDGTSGLYVWGAQLETGAGPTNYAYTTTAAAYGPRFDYNPSNCPSNVCSLRGLLVEDTRTNMLLNSEALTSWGSSSGVGVTASTAITAPDGSATSYLLNDSSSSTNAYLEQVVTIPNDSSVYTCSAFVHAGTAAKTQLNLNIYGGTSTNGYGVTMTWASSTITCGSTNCSSLALPNGWYRISVTGPNNSTGNTSAACYIYPSSWISGGTTTGTAYAWGGQLEQANSPSSYIPTTSAQATRAQDLAVVNDMSSVSDNQGTLVARATAGPMFDNSTFSTIQAIASLDIDSNHRIQIRRCGSGSTTSDGHSCTMFYFSGTAWGNSEADGTWPMFTTRTVAMAYDAKSVPTAAEGSFVAITTGTTGLFTPTALRIGDGAALTKFNGWLQRVQYYPNRVNDAVLRALTSY